MNFRNLLCDQIEGIALITINRPEVRNALDSECWEEIDRVIDHINSSKAIQVAIFTGAGDRAFVGGLT